MADVRAVSERLKAAIETALPNVLNNKQLNWEPSGVRATSHVDDIVFISFLYQLVDYFPPDRSGSSRAGRRFSQRYGIIGQSWRLNESLGRGAAVSGMADPSPTRDDRKRAIKQLVEKWGMTEEEAGRVSHERPATLSVMLRYDGQRYGVLYIDSTRENAFGADSISEDQLPTTSKRADANDVARALEVHAVTVRLARAVGEALEPLRLAAPFLEVGQ